MTARRRDIPDPDTVLPWRGVKQDARTIAMVDVVEARLGRHWTVTQGGYNPGGVSASGGTHDKAALDIAWTDHWEDDYKAARDVGFAAWPRPAIAGLWPNHIHMVPVGGNLSPAAAQQVTAYLKHLDGLASNRPDAYHYHPSPQHVFNYWKEAPMTEAERKQLIRELLDTPLYPGAPTGSDLSEVTVRLALRKTYLGHEQEKRP